MKYIDNKPENGIEYDLKEIYKVYKSLSIPHEFDFVPWDSLMKCKYILQNSERSIGKTTCALLLGMCFNKLYGTEIQYIRSSEDMLAPSHATTLIKAILEYKNGYYIEKLTDGVYNSIYYHWKQFFYCRIDENGDRIATANTPFIQCLSIDNNYNYKSSYNAPKGDFIIFDEFIGKYYPVNEFIEFMDLLKTIGRDRQSPIIFMLANTINPYSQYYEEFGISKEIKTLKKGEHRIITTEGGTVLHIEICESKKPLDKKKLLTSLFFGFNNPKLASITGGEIWGFAMVKHIPKQTNKIVFVKNIYIRHAFEEYLQLEFAKSDELPLHIEIHKATRVNDDGIVLAIDNNAPELFGLGNRKIETLIQRLFKSDDVFYSTNEVGALFKNYLATYIRKRKEL